MEVEIFFWSLRLRIGRGEPRERGGGRDHQEGKGLGARRREAFFLPILDVVGINATDSIEKLGILLVLVVSGIQGQFDSSHYVLKPWRERAPAKYSSLQVSKSPSSDAGNKEGERRGGAAI